MHKFDLDFVRVEVRQERRCYICGDTEEAHGEANSTTLPMVGADGC